MKVKFILLFLILISFLFFFTVEAQDIFIIFPEKPTVIHAGKLNEIEILLKNNRNLKDTFYFSLWGEPALWTRIDKSWVTLDAGETTSLLLKIEPPRDAEKGTHVFSISVLSLTSKVLATKNLYLEVVRGSDVLIQEVKIEKQILKPEEKILIQPILVNLNKKEKIDFLVTVEILKDKLSIKKFDEAVTLEPKTTKTLSFSFLIEKTQEPGDYGIKVTVKDSLNRILDEKSSGFKVETIRKIEQKKETKNSIVYSDVTISVKNEGNVKEKDFYIVETMPLISKYFFFPEVEPSLKEEKENRIVYKWFISQLKPGETLTIKYQLRFTNVVFMSSALLVTVVWATWFYYRPTIKKDYIGFLEEKKEVTVSLNIKNRTKKILKKILIRDFVPAVASVVKKFDTLRPKIKKKSTGTELTWAINQLKPKEERIITYRIKPLLDIIGGLKLPKAYLLYESKKGTKKILSRAVTVRRKVK